MNYEGPKDLALGWLGIFNNLSRYPFDISVIIFKNILFTSNIDFLVNLSMPSITD